MEKDNIWHLIRAAEGLIVRSHDLGTVNLKWIIIGSQSAILSPEMSNQNKDTMPIVFRSVEADVIPYDNVSLDNPMCEKIADLIDGAIGEDSPFHDMFGFYAQGVGVETAILPKNWLMRLEKNFTPDRYQVYSLDFHDLIVAKALANREKDWEFISDVKELIDKDKFDLRLKEVEDERVTDSQKNMALSRVIAIKTPSCDYGFGM